MRLQALTTAAICAALLAGCNPKEAEKSPPERSAGSKVAMAATGYQAKVVSAKELKAYVDRKDVVIVDVRPEESYASEHIAGAVNVPWAKLKNGHAQLPKDRFIALYCT